MKKYGVMVLMSVWCVAAMHAMDTTVTANTKPEVGIDEHLGAVLPLDLTFTDYKGNHVALKDVIKKPTILNFVYYKCPGICSPIMTELASVVDHLDMQIGKDYQILTISFDQHETTALASAKHDSYMSLLDKKIPDGSWDFMTGDSASIHTLTDAAGFIFKRQGNQFLHGGCIIAISPKGKIARYLYGTEYLPFDVKMALTEASEGRTGPTIAKVLSMCFSYDPAGRRYAFDFTRVAGGIVLVFTVGIVVYFSVKPKKKVKS